MMKKLKKLSLKKEVIVNLNDSEMNRLQGGSGHVCATIAISIASAALTYEVGKDVSLYLCDPVTPTPSPNQPSENWIWVGNQRCCKIDDVYVYGFNTGGN